MHSFGVVRVGDGPVRENTDEDANEEDVQLSAASDDSGVFGFMHLIEFPGAFNVARCVLCVFCCWLHVIPQNTARKY